MKCPYCQTADSRVLESREARAGDAIRRRRECEQCRRRFTTFEEVERPRLFLVKRDGTREEFSREKLLHSLRLACRKRPVSIESLEATVIELERELQDLGEVEIASHEVGRRVMARLQRLDGVAYVRFASVYEQFESPEEFGQLVQSLREHALL